MTFSIYFNGRVYADRLRDTADVARAIIECFEGLSYDRSSETGAYLIVGLPDVGAYGQIDALHAAVVDWFCNAGGFIYDNQPKEKHT